MIKNIAILTTCHFVDNDQITYIKRCLSSLVNQTYKSNVLFSISYKNNEMKNLFNNEIKNNFQSVIYYENNEYHKYDVKAEFEHYDNLTQYIQNYDYITICEVDDFYENNRIEVLVNSITEKNKCDNMEYIGVSERNYKQPKTKHFLVGACSYMLKPFVFTRFFDIIHEKKMEKYLTSYRCYTLFSTYMHILTCISQKIYYFTVYDKLYCFEGHKKIEYYKKYIKSPEIDLSRKRDRIYDDFISCLFEDFNLDFNLQDFLNYVGVKKNNLPIKKYAEIKNLILSFYFVNKN